MSRLEVRAWQSDGDRRQIFDSVTPPHVRLSQGRDGELGGSHRPDPYLQQKDQGLKHTHFLTKYVNIATTSIIAPIVTIEPDPSITFDGALQVRKQSKDTVRCLYVA